VLLLAIGLSSGHLHWTSVFVPLVFLPLIVLAMGCGWFLASIGVFVRDIAQVVGMAMAVLMFLSPVFFPVSALPVRLQSWVMLNPLTFIIEQMRAVLIWGHLPDWIGLTAYLAVSIGVALLGYAWFQKTRTGFADVL
jgi:lipopolysaccharide transport system permease protein